MSQIGENRVFDKTSLEELKEQATALMDCAKAVTEELQTEANTLKSIATQIPAEAKDGALEGAASSLLATLNPEPFETMKTYLTNILDKLTTQIPSYDAESSNVLSELTASAVSLKGMVSELASLVGSGTLSLSLEEFSGKLEEYQKKWQEGTLTLAQKMELAMTYLKGMVLTSCFSKDPVNLSTGNFYYEKEDLKIRGLMPLVFKRCYNALDQSGGTLGHGWSHSLEVFLAFPEKNPGTLLLHKGDGKEVTFLKHEKEWKDIHTGRETIEESEEGYRYQEGNLCHIFDKEGKRISCEDENGNVLHFTYDEAGLLLTASQGDLGGVLHFTYKDNRSLKEVTDHTGRKLTFFYVEGRLDEVTDPEGHTISYRYDSEGRIRAVKNARGILSVRNEYDEKGRVTRQRFPDKGEMRYEYLEAENKTILTERNGSKITYEQDNKLRNIGVYYEDGSEHTEYNQQDQIICRTDCNGNQTHYQYDKQGNLSCVRDALGEESRFTYDHNRKLTSIHRGTRKLVHNTYDAKGRLVNTKDALGRCQKNLYNSRGLVEKVTQPDGSRIRFTYDARGNVTGIRDPYGAESRYEYDALNRVTATMDGCGNRTVYTYDRMDRIINVTDPAGNTRSYSYNESGKVTEIKDFDGGIMTVEYNHLNRPEVLRDKQGRETRRKYDRMWNLAEETGPTGATTRYQYDSRNRLQRVELCADKESEPTRVFTYIHDPNGNLTETVAGDDKELFVKKSYEYDALNRCIAETNEEGNRILYEYDALGNLTALTDPAGNRTTYAYDAAGQKIWERDAIGRYTHYTYNLLGQVESITDPAGRTTRYLYEPGGRLKEICHPDGRRLLYTYDANGNILTIEDENGYVLSYRYDCLNRVTSITGSDGAGKCYTYDALGNLSSMTEANGAVTAYEYSLSGKLTTVTDALGNRTEYQYDAMDNLLHVCRRGEGKEFLTTYRRNSFGQIECTVDALGGEEHYAYDALGRLLSKTDREVYTTRYRYTPGGETASILYGDGSRVEMEYDALRRLIQVRDWLGETCMERDAMGRPERIRDHTGRETAYEWGVMDERRSMTYPDGRKVSYHYDEKFRFADMEIRTPEGVAETIHYSYDGFGRLIRKEMPGGLATLWQYNEKGQPEELIHTDRKGVVDRYSYEYDLTGNKTAIRKERRGLEEESGSYAYTYDLLGRLEGVSKDGAMLRSYAYDAFGNRKEMRQYLPEVSSDSIGTFADSESSAVCTRYTYDALDRLLTAREAGGSLREYRYDRRGNLTEERINGELAHSYSYGAMNRLCRATNGQGAEALYRYNGLGQRTGRIVEGEEERYLLDLTRPYHNLLGITSGGKEQTFYWDGNIAAMEETVRGTFHYYLQDELGSPLRVNGYEVRTEKGYLNYGYDEFGEDLYGEYGEPYADLDSEGIPNPYSRQGEEQPFGYTGYRKDAVSGTYFAQAREYLPKTGRFMAEDVVRGNGAVPVTLNRYGYCWGNPINLVDYNGETPNNILDIYIEDTNEQNWLPDMYIQAPPSEIIYPEGFVPNTYIQAPDPDATYISYDDNKKAVEVSLQFGAGFYVEESFAGMKVGLGAKAFRQISNSNFWFPKQGVELGGALSLFAGVDTGYRRVICPMYDNKVEESGLYFEPNLLGIKEEDSDLIYSSSLGLFLGVGVQLDVDINISIIRRWMEDKLHKLLNNDCG